MTQEPPPSSGHMDSVCVKMYVCHALGCMNFISGKSVSCKLSWKGKDPDCLGKRELCTPAEHSG